MLQTAISCLQLIIQLATIITLIFTFIKFTQKPTENLSDRVLALENWRKDIDRKLNDSDAHFDALDESNKITQRALLALIDSALNAESGKEKLEDARDKLDEYLTSK